MEIPDREQLLMQVQSANRKLDEINRDLLRLNAELEHQKSTLDMVLAGLSDTVIILDRDLRFVYVDAAFARSFGHSPEEMLGRKWEELGLPARDVAELLGRAGKVFSTGNRARGETHNTAGAGSWCEYIITPLREPSGGAEQVLIVSRDITERKQVEDALRESEERYRSIFALSHAVMLVIDPATGAIVDANPAASAYYGYPHELLTRMTIAEINTLSPEEIFAEMQKAKEGRKRHFAFRHRLANGEIRDVDVYSGQVVIGGRRLLHTIVHDVSDRKANEEKMRQQADLLNLASEIIIVRDLDDRITFWNAGGEGVYGWSRQEAEGRIVHDLLKTQYPRPLGEISDELFREGIWEGELVQTRRDGSEIVIASRWVVQRDEAGRPRAILEADEDITGKKRMELALQESEARFREAFEHAPIGMVLNDLKGRYLHVNQAYREIVGYDEEELLRPEFDFIRLTHPEDRESYREAFDRLLAGETPAFFLEKRNIRKDGSTVWVRASVTIRRDAAGRPFQMVGLVEDISTRKRAEEALRESEERYRALVELSPDAIFLHHDRIFSYANPAAIRLFCATSPADIVGRDILDLVHPDCWKLVEARTKETQEKGRVPPQELKILRFDGSYLYVESTRSLIHHGGEPIILTVMRDITGRKQAETERTRLYRELESAHREANLYLDIITHDIRNANNVALMYASLLIETLSGEEQAYARKLKNGIDKSTEILRSVATIRKIHEELVPLKQVRLDRVIRSEMEAYPDTEIRYSGASTCVRADELLPEVFTNLLSNAVKFGGSGVQVTVTVEDRGRDVLVTVADSGPGVPEENKELIFRRFERGQEEGRGEGLGLYITKTLVERYGGRIWAEDRISGCPKEGAAFKFTLQKSDCADGGTQDPGGLTV